MAARGARSTDEAFERRKKPRIYVPFHTRVQGVDDAGNDFSIETVLDNISSDGLYLRMMPYVEKGAKLAIDIDLRTAPRIVEEGPRLSIEAVVLRSEKVAGGAFGVGVSFVKVHYP